MSSVARHTRPLAGALLVMLLLTGCGNLVSVTPTGDLALRPAARTSVMLADDGSVLAELHAEEDREPVDIEDVPTVVRDAVVAIEDERFYTHSGVDARAIARAVVTNARSGEIKQGGSTITQQLAKNTVTGTDQTIDRKLEEASVALQLEHTYSKDEILEQYLNTVYFGNGAYGVQSAAERYFGANVVDLDLPQAALLAGLLRSPGTYDPFTQPDEARNRRDTVIRKMSQRRLVTRQAADLALAAPLGVIAKSATTPWRAPYFVSHVLDQLQHDPLFAALGHDAAERANKIFRGGLRIETTLDPSWQQHAQEAVASTLDRPDDPRAAAVVIDPSTGHVRAMVGGRDWNDSGDPVARFNLATQARRQPGSTFKEIVLAAALAQGWTLDRTLPAPGTIDIAARPGDPGVWTVANYADVDYGEVTLREATAKSINTVYAQLVDSLGARAVVDMAHRLGVRSPLRPYRSVALGAQEVTVMDMAAVQATLAAGGIYRQPSTVKKVTTADGTVLYEHARSAGEQVLDGEVAWQVTTALETVVTHGTGGRADLRRPTAGKTGTTQDTADAWFTGYTPDFAAAVWVGFHEGRIPMEPPRTRIRVEGGTWPAEIFAKTALRALENTPATPFLIPEVALTRIVVDLSRDCLPTAFTPPEVIGERAYLTGTEPTKACDDTPTKTVADVPDVVGKSWEAAQAMLEEAGLRAVPQPTFTLTVPPGFAISQNPPAGRERTLSGGYEVRVRVSSSDRATVAIPSVVGMPLPEALAELEHAGFPVDVERECPADAHIGDAATGSDERDGTATPTVRDCQGQPGIVYEQTPGSGSATIHSVVQLRAYPNERADPPPP